jgi:Asp-tRNA(Asn)/Glu-tRNA(Gln) amidotransferase B subunit|tara:strand:+ start:1970 stop:2425 length:456 start_codon:yes stop_codon:yes gene_type:complete
MMNKDEQEQSERRHVIAICLDEAEDVDNAVQSAVSRGKDAASSVGETIRETIQAVRTARPSVVMVRVNKESLAKLDELVDSGINSSRSEAAAFMIAEGIKAKSDLFDKIAEKTELIRQTREQLRLLLDEDDIVIAPDQPVEESSDETEETA